MVADLDTAPMPAHQRLPLLRRAFVALGTRQVVARIRGSLTCFLHRDLAAHHDDTACEGEINRERLHGKRLQLAHFHPAVT